MTEREPRNDAQRKFVERRKKLQEQIDTATLGTEFTKIVFEETYPSPATLRAATNYTEAEVRRRVLLEGQAWLDAMATEAGLSPEQKLRIWERKQRNTGEEPFSED
jgi:hypothetical protein